MLPLQPVAAVGGCACRGLEALVQVLPEEVGAQAPVEAVEAQGLDLKGREGRRGGRACEAAGQAMEGRRGCSGAGEGGWWQPDG